LLQTWSSGQPVAVPIHFSKDTQTYLHSIPRKRVVVNEFMQANSPDIYVIGDSASTQFSGMAQTAITDAIQLSDNFKRFAEGQPIVEYSPKQPVYVVPIGHEWAVAQVGETISFRQCRWLENPP
jgi:NADH dehydrogenase FAD-containing subunit